VTEPSHAVFLSYASQDAEAAQSICTALRSAGVEVWFDQSELRGGDAWDRQIRKQIHDCALFVPVISTNSDARHEGYFRREWRLAVDRAGDMAEDIPFLLPVVIDSTPDATARVPDRFREVQWSRLPGGQASPAFIERVQRLLSPAPDHAPAAHLAAPSVFDAALRARRPPRGPSWSKPAVWVTVAVVVFAALAYFVADKFWIPKHVTPSPAVFSPPPHSIAVLPFVNLSGDASQDYFSDGLTEELLNSLAEIEGLQVAARTSSFSFKEHPDIATVAHKLNVGAVLEGSVRRSEHTVRVTAQLINALTGFHLWSKTYDRDLGDVLKLQTEIATAVAGALKVALLGDVAAKVELGGTRNPAAFDAYLRGAKSQSGGHEAKEVQAAIDAFTDAIRLDPNYALAYAARSVAVNDYAGYWTSGVAAIQEGFEKAVADGRQAILLAPELGEGHRALANAFESLLDFRGANEEYDRAVALAPGNARVLRDYGTFSVLMGRTDAGVAATRHVVTLDPLNRDTHEALGNALAFARKYEAAIAAYNDALALDSAYSQAYAGRGVAQYALGELKGATLSCEMKTGDFVYYLVCLAMTYDKLGRHTDAEAMLAKLKKWMGEGDAYQYVEIYAQWGDKERALRWLETAWRLRDAGLGGLRVDFLLDPLRHEPRFQAIERELKFPD
jgi:TolB-like protein/tetratricopeptide (TPR) repeat protein